MQNYAKTIVLLVRELVYIADSSSLATYCGVSHGRGFDLHASPKAHCFRQIQVLHKDFSEEPLLPYQALARETVQSTMKTLINYGIPEVKIPHFRSQFLCKCVILQICIKISGRAHPRSVIQNSINTPSDSSSYLRFSMTLAVAGAASRLVPIFANVLTSSTNISSYLSLPTLTSRLISY